MQQLWVRYFKKYQWRRTPTKTWRTFLGTDYQENWNRKIQIDQNQRSWFQDVIYYNRLHLWNKFFEFCRLCNFSSRYHVACQAFPKKKKWLESYKINRITLLTVSGIKVDLEMFKKKSFQKNWDWKKIQDLQNIWQLQWYMYITMYNSKL